MNFPAATFTHLHKYSLPKVILASFGFAFFLFLNASPLWSQTPTPATQQVSQVITLKDGTVLKGSLVNVAGDNYTIQTEHLGQLSISASQIASIVPITGAPSSANLPSAANLQAMIPSSLQGPMQQVQQNVLSDPDLVNSIQEVAKDPEVMNLLLDPNLIQTIMSMDPQQVQNNPGVQKLLQNPKMQEIFHKIEQKMGGSLLPAGQAGTGGQKP